MDRQLAALLGILYREGGAHDGPLADRPLRLRNMTPEAAGLIALLIRAQRGRSVLEIPTSNGYSAIWFADAVRDTGGRLTTVETDAVRVEAALRNLERAGVSDHVDVVHGDGGEVPARTEDASVDLVVLDAERPAYVECWPQLRRVLAPHGIVAVDNAMSHRDRLTAFSALVAETGDFAVDLREVGDGVLTAVRIR
ncbi:O-methyltransferase [Streptomyces sp. HUAS TT20]|uniref:O-methyltransferase n=1 Tax=Streptomyces sp. HUAS TT20 TaxID=3447509 RepID=UPI0021DB4DEB|nr:class I SAM-dependent methyltransferase [Streptomyces sp. HUAS 15-9]UXY30581.1 class I SAM-dependent methyltransferase [Streptomyces sp. HUAS 15-9]